MLRVCRRGVPADTYVTRAVTRHTLPPQDHDGLVPAEALGGYEVFAPLPLLALGAVLERWAWSSGTPGLLSVDDFVRWVWGGGGGEHRQGWWCAVWPSLGWGCRARCLGYIRW